jgi:hypothetical protein
MFKAWMKSLVREIINEPLVAKDTSRVDRLISETVPTALVHRIDNGFLVTTIDQYHSMQSQIHFCKDAKDIAEHFVANAVKQKMGLQESIAVVPQTMGLRKP